MATNGDNSLKRGLHSRHLTMIAIGGAIGTGLFVASGETISTAGPGGALVAYAAIGLMVYLLMQSLGEMATFLPVAGSFEEYGRRFVSPSFGFAIGWNYWYNWAITVAAELAAAALVMKFWFPDTPGWMWSAIFLTILVTLNALSARAYGEGEFWFALVKVVTVVVFLVLGVLMIVGVMGGSSPGFENWTEGEAPFVGGGLGILAVFMVAGFSFQGTELVAVAAGEVEHPEKNVPRAIRTIFWRILPVLHRSHHCDRFPRALHRSESLEVRYLRYLRFSLHACVRSCWCGGCGGRDERRDLDLGSFGGKLRTLRLHQNAVRPCVAGERPEVLQEHQFPRRANSGAHCHNGRRGHVLYFFAYRGWPGLYLACERFRIGRVHHVDGSGVVPLEVPQGDLRPRL